MTAPIDRDRILAAFTRTRAILTAADVAELLDDGRTGNEIGYRLKMLAANGDLVAVGKLREKGKAVGYRAASVAPDDVRPFTASAKATTERTVVEVTIGDDAAGYAGFVARIRHRQWVGVRGQIAQSKGDARVFGTADAAWAALEGVK